jgi:NADP-dependent 3-hydroxy acid dehydrogenase YdfG
MPEKLTNLAVNTFGRLDGLVLNHGILISSKIEQTSIESFKNLYNINVFSCLAMVSHSRVHTSSDNIG